MAANPITTVEELDKLVQKMHLQGDVHRKRGYRLDSISIATVTNHMIAEAVEFQEACIALEGQTLEDKKRSTLEARFEESADMLANYLHLNFVVDLPLSLVVQRAQRKLEERFCPKYMYRPEE